VRKITDRLPAGVVAILPQDSYFWDSSHLPLEERLEINFDHPASIEFELLTKHLKELKKGHPIQQPIYSYLTCTRSEETVPVNPCKVIIVEGILILSNPELRKLMDLKIFVDADADDRLIRVINRDIVERGRSVNKVMERYECTVKPMHLQFIEPTKRFADIIVPQGGNNHIAIDILTKYIENNLK
jgi:uridine kinase